MITLFLAAVFSFTALAATKFVPYATLAVMLKVPGGFSAKPAVETLQEGVGQRVWFDRGASTPESAVLVLQFMSVPLTKGENMDMYYAPKRQQFEKCTVKEKNASAPILEKSMKDTGKKTTEKLFTFDCDATRSSGAYRFITGTGPHSDAVFILSYLSKKGYSRTQPIETMEKVLSDMEVVLAKDFQFLNKK